MAKRGMLPKFRPAQLGGDTLARPSIRPVKPSPPPPPPSPPRKSTSGFGARPNREHEIASDHRAHDAHDAHDELDASTANGVSAHGEPSTLNRGPRTVAQEIAREIVQASPRGGRVDAISFDDETQARRADTGLLDKMRRDALLAAAPPPVAARPAHLGVDYESLPSLEVRPPFDSYEAAFEEHDPVTQLGRAHESAQMARARREEPSYREPSYKEPSYREASYQEPSYREPSYKEPSYEEREPAYREASYEPPPSSYDARARESSYEDSRAPAPGSYYPGAAPSFPASALGNEGDRAQNDQEPWPRREESGPRERPRAPSPSSNDVNDSAQWSRDQGAQPVAGWSSLPPVNKTAQGIGPSQQHLIDRERERIEAAMSPQIPPSPRVPNEMHPAFVVGVQPLRNPTPGPAGFAAHALPSPQQAIHSSMPAQYGQPHARQAYPTPAPSYQAQPQQAQHHYQPPNPQQYVQQHYSSHPPHAQMIPRQHVATPGAHGAPGMQSSMHSAPVGAQLTQAPAATPKIGRFAWFVAGAAFGITFAFFATGFFSAGTKPSDFPAPAPLPTVTATAPAATAPAATAPAATAPAAPTAPAALAPTAPTALAPVAPAVAPVAPASPSAVAPSALAAPAAAAPPARPPTRRALPPPPPRRPSAPTSQAPKNLGGGGQGADDERPAPAAPSGGGADIGDLLGAGLKP